MTGGCAVFFDDGTEASLGDALAQASPGPRLTLRISTRVAATLAVACAFTSALVARVPRLEARRWDVEGALQEAIGNAVIHGNLGLASDLRCSLEGLARFGRLMESGLADPILAAKPILIDSHWTESALTLSVTDQGRGFDPLSLATPMPGAKFGRGLSTIRTLCDSVAFSEDGRRISMVIGG